jgi:predicted dehydrogenase
VTRRVRIGLAGLGRMGRIHAANLAARCPSAQLAWVFDADPDVARQVGEQLEVPWTASFDDILADGGVDAMAIAAPTRAHAELWEHHCALKGSAHDRSSPLPALLGRLPGRLPSGRHRPVPSQR